MAKSSISDDHSTLKFVVNGKEVLASELIRNAPKQSRTTTAKNTAYHKGWRVEGHPPGALEAAKIEADNELMLFLEMQKAGRAHGKQPMSWDENYWRNNHKKKPVRAKPYEVPDAAEVCADLARKAGWLDVVVTAISHG